MNTNLLAALQRISSRRQWPSQRLLDTLYGSQAKPVRAEVAGILAGKQVRPSAPEAQYGKLRTALLAAVGATGECKASEDAAFEEKASELLAAGL